MENVCNILDDKRILSLELNTPIPLEGESERPQPAQRLRNWEVRHEFWTPLLSRIALYGAGAVFLIGLSVALFFATTSGGDFVSSFLAQTRGPLVDKFMLGRDNLAVLIFDVTIMVTSILFLFTVPDIHAVNRHCIDITLISPARASINKWGNYGGSIGLALGIAGSFAGRLAPTESPIPYMGGSINFLGPQDLGFLGFAIGAVCYGILGLARVSFLRPRVAKGMVSAGIATCILVGIKAHVQLPPMVVIFLDWGLFLAAAAWMTALTRAYLKTGSSDAPKNPAFAEMDPAVQKTLWALGITSQDKLAGEDSRELGAILGVSASRVDLWKGMPPLVPASERPQRLTLNKVEAIKTEM